MCTAVHYQTKGHYFGRTLDYEHAYQETVTVTLGNYPLVPGQQIKKQNKGRILICWRYRAYCATLRM